MSRPDITDQLRVTIRDFTIGGYEARLLRDSLAEIERLRDRIARLEDRAAKAVPIPGPSALSGAEASVS